MRSTNGRTQDSARCGSSLPDVAAAVTAGLILVGGLLPALGSVRRSSKADACLTNLMRIGYANAVYASQDPADMALPVHPMQFFQCVSINNPTGPCSGAIYVGAYEWGGKSGIGKTDNALFPGSTNPLNSRYGTKIGFGPSTRPLNSILYPQTFPDHGGLRPGNPLEYEPIDAAGALSDTTLDLELHRCPADTGYTGIHCPSFKQSGLTSYDHFGTSYHANMFLTGIVGTGNPLASNSPYLHRMSDILAPSETLAYQENNGRWAWAAAPEACKRDSPLQLPGLPGQVRGWHGRDWTFNAAFIDGHADTIYMRGYRNPDIGRYPEGASFGAFACIIIRGEGWQIDTLPVPRVATQLLSPSSGGRPSYEGCFSGSVLSGSTGERAIGNGPACPGDGRTGCAAW